MTKKELDERVKERKEEIQTEQDKLKAFIEKVKAFIAYIKSKSTIYALVKNLSVWKELEKLIDEKS